MFAQKTSFIVIAFLLISLAIPFSFAYIDPGTGGYLISSLWAYIVGIFTFVFAIVVRFFRYTIMGYIRKIAKKNPLAFRFSIAGVSIVILLGLFIFIQSLFFASADPGFKLNPYDATKEGVIFYNESASVGGYTLLEGELIDMQGETVRSWNYTYLSFISSEGFYYAQRDYETLEWGKFTFDDEPVWIKELAIHHEITETLDGNIIVLTKEVDEYNGRNVEFDVVLEFTPDGELVDRWSTWDNLEYLQKFHRKLELDKPANAILPDNHEKNTSIWGAEHDYYHMNGLSIVPPNEREGFHPAFKSGNWIISFRHGSMVIIMDSETKEVRWSGIASQIPGDIEGQHSPYMNAAGNVVIFDNGRYRGTSRVIEVNPIDMSIVSEYLAEDFFTYSQGYVQPLPDGHKLITESEDGYLFELNSKDEKVWEYYYPHSIDDAEDGLVRDDVYRAYRYGYEFINSLQ